MIATHRNQPSLAANQVIAGCEIIVAESREYFYML